MNRSISFFIVGIIAISGLPSMVLADVINAPTYYSVQSDLNYEITTNITSSWINHESTDFVLTNTGSETIHNWYLTFNTPYSIDNIWNGALYETDGNGTYTITSNGWNQDIHSGESVTVGITFSSDTEEDLSVDPEWYLLNTQAAVIDASQYTLEYIEYSAWETGFTGQLTLTPQVDCQHWELSFDSNKEITAVSSAVLISEGENNYAITHDENNMRLFAGNAYNFGIQGVNTEDPLEFSNVELTVVDLAYHLTDDEDANGVPDYLDFIGGGSIIDPTPTPTPVPTGEPSETPTPTEVPIPTECETDLIDEFSDRDSDKLLDYQEEMYGTDPDNPDTDGDGLLDGDEVNLLYNPKERDTDGNGIIDWDEDYDGDGLTNGGEYATGTCLFAPDSDYDGINDLNEVYLYGTDPRNEDSDFDGIKDGDELTIGLNPGSNDSDNDGVTDDMVTFYQSLSMSSIAEDHPHEISSIEISGNISGLITSNTRITDTYNIDVYTTDVYGRIGVPFNIESDGYFDSMTLTINYDESLLGDTLEENLGVLWFDEENGVYVDQEQAIVDADNNTVTVELEHFSTYVLVDELVWKNPLVPNYSWYLVYDGCGYYGEKFTGPYDPVSYEEQAWEMFSNGNHWTRLELATSNVRWTFRGNHFSYTWLLIDLTDEDEDNVPDFMETQGVLGANHHIYYSEVGPDDSDGDGISDAEEFGDMFIVSKYRNDAPVTIYRKNVSGGVEPFLESLTIDDYYGIVPTKLPVIFSFGTNPGKYDMDDDGFSDSEDAIPRTANEDMVYLFTLSDFAEFTEMRQARLEQAGYLCTMIELQGISQFVADWDGIGLYSDYYIDGSKKYGDKYYYNAKYVIISTHGSSDAISLGCNEYIFTEAYSNIEGSSRIHIILDALKEKRIECLCMYACSCGGESENGRNLALEFLDSSDTISNVIAPDTRIYFYGAGFYMIGYDESVWCSEEEYNNALASCSCWYDVRNKDCQYLARGFMLFSRENQTEELLVEDIYSNDVYYGVLYTYDNVSCVIVFDYNVEASIVGTYYDPALDEWDIA